MKRIIKIANLLFYIVIFIVFIYFVFQINSKKNIKNNKFNENINLEYFFEGILLLNKKQK